MPLESHLEPVFALAMVPAEWAGVIVGGLAAAVTAQWRVYLKSDDRRADEQRKALEIVHAATATSQKLIEVSTTNAANEQRFREEVLREVGSIKTELERLRGKAG